MRSFGILGKRTFYFIGRIISAFSRLMPRLVRGQGRLSAQFVGQDFYKLFQVLGEWVWEARVGAGECTTIMSSTPSRAVARPAASNTRQFLESFA